LLITSLSRKVAKIKTEVKLTEGHVSIVCGPIQPPLRSQQAKKYRTKNKSNQVNPDNVSHLAKSILKDRGHLVIDGLPRRFL